MASTFTLDRHTFTIRLDLPALREKTGFPFRTRKLAEDLYGDIQKFLVILWALVDDQVEAVGWSREEFHARILTAPNAREITKAINAEAEKLLAMKVKHGR